MTLFTGKKNRQADKDGKQEEGQHDEHHAHGRHAVPDRSPEQKEKRHADERPATEADQLPLGQIECDFGFDFRQVFGYGYISHFRVPPSWVSAPETLL